MPTAILKNPVLRKYLMESGLGAAAGGATGAAVSTHHGESREGKVNAVLTGIALGAAIPFGAGQFIRSVRYGLKAPKLKSDVHYEALSEAVKNVENRRDIAAAELGRFNFRSAMENAHSERVGRILTQIKRGTGGNTVERSLKKLEAKASSLGDRIESLSAQRDAITSPAHQAVFGDTIRNLRSERKQATDFIRKAKTDAERQQNRLRSAADKKQYEKSIDWLRGKQERYMDRMRKQLRNDIYGKWLGVY